MRESVEKWINERKKEISEEERIRRARMLINNGLCEEKEITKEEYKSGRRNKMSEFVYESEEKIVDDRRIEKYYRKCALELTNEEYNEVSKYFADKATIDDDENPIGETIKKVSVAWLLLVFLGGLIAAIVYAVATQSILSFILIFGSVLLAGCFMYCFLAGFGHLVSDVKGIKNNLKNKK